MTSRHRFWHIFLNIFDIIYFTIACVAGHGAPRIPPASAERSMLQAAGGQTCENARGPPRSSRKYPAPLYSSIQRAGVSGCPSHHGSRRGPRPMRCADPPGRTLVRRADGTDELRGSAVRDRPDRVQLTVLWNGCAERLIGSIRRECIDHVIMSWCSANVICATFCYCTKITTTPRALTWSLNKDAPVPRGVEWAANIVCRPILGGLHHQYGRM